MLISFRASTQLRRLYCAVIKADEEEEEEFLPNAAFTGDAAAMVDEGAALRSARTPDRCAMAPVKIRYMMWGLDRLSCWTER